MQYNVVNCKCPQNYPRPEGIVFSLASNQRRPVVKRIYRVYVVYVDSIVNSIQPYDRIKCGSPADADLQYMVFILELNSCLCLLKQINHRNGNDRLFGSVGRSTAYWTVLKQNNSV